MPTPKKKKQPLNLSLPTKRKFCDLRINANSTREAQVAKTAINVQKLFANLIQPCPFRVHERNGAPADAKALNAKLHAVGVAREREVDVSMDYLRIKMARVVAE